MKVKYEGGSLFYPDCGALTHDEWEGPIAIFHKECFNSDGEWLPEVIEALREIVYEADMNKYFKLRTGWSDELPDAEARDG